MTPPPGSRPTLADVAREAGVSTATSDRVLNGRAGARSRTAQQVLQAAQRLQYRPEADLQAAQRPPPFRLACLLPEGSSEYVRQLGLRFESSRALAARHDIVCRCASFTNFDADALVARLQELAASHDGIAVMPFENPAVREALQALTQRGLPVVTLISDIAHAGRAAYLGLDNRAAGRAAGFLLGRFLGAQRRGRVAVLAGSMHYRAHEEREIGFMGQLRERFPQLQLVSRNEGMDDTERTYAIACELLRKHPTLDAIYNAGGASQGIARALKEAGRAGQTVFVGHGLAPDTRALLIDGTMDALLTQDPQETLLDCLKIFANLHARREALRGVAPTRCHVVLRDTLPP